MSSSPPRRVVRVAASCLTVVLTAAFLSACGGSGSDDKKDDTPVSEGTVNLDGKKFAFAIPDGSGPVFVLQAKRFKEQAEQLGATVDVYDNKGSAQAMLTNANLMVASKPDVIVEYPSVANATKRVGDIFKRADIPCISLNVPVPGCPLFNFDQPYMAALGATEMAKQMEARGWTAENTTVILGQALELGPSVNIAGQSFYASLSTQVPGMTPVKAEDITTSTTTINGDEGVQVDMGLTIDGAYAKTRDVIQTIPKDRNIVIYTVQDDSTIGARRAADNAGRKNVIATGYGSTENALKAIRADDGWVTDQTGFLEYWGEFALAMAAAVEQGAELPELTAPPMLVVTKDNVDKYFKPGTAELIQMPPLPKISKYLEKTGVLQKYGNVEGLK